MTVNLVASDFLSLLNSFHLVLQNASMFFAAVSWKRAASCADVSDSSLLAANWAGGARQHYNGHWGKNPQQEIIIIIVKLHIKGHSLTKIHTIKFFPFDVFCFHLFLLFSKVSQQLQQWEEPCRSILSHVTQGTATPPSRDSSKHVEEEQPA